MALSDSKRQQSNDRSPAEADRAQLFAALSRISDALADIPVEEIETEVQRTIAESRARRRSEATEPA